MYGDYLECNFCRFILLGIRKYLMVCYFKNKYLDKFVLYFVEWREVFYNDVLVFFGYVLRLFYRFL